MMIILYHEGNTYAYCGEGEDCAVYAYLEEIDSDATIVMQTIDDEESLFDENNKIVLSDNTKVEVNVYEGGEGVLI